MILRKIRNIILVIMLLGFSGVSWAVPFPNPDPLTFGDDIDGTGLFAHGDFTINLEIFDLVDFASSGLIGSQFGFYYGADPFNTLTPIFQVDDNPSPQAALVDFTTGVVLDLDGGPPLEAVFDNSLGNADIGFYLAVPDLTAPGLPLVPIFTQALLNPGGADLAAEYPFLSSPFSFLIGFALPIAGGTVPLGLSIVSPLAPSPIPIPGAAGLWLLGIAGLALFRRKVARVSSGITAGTTDIRV